MLLIKYLVVFEMSLRDVLIDNSWTPNIQSVINNDLDIESITYYFSDTSTNISGYADFARDFINEVDARLDIDFVEASNNDSTTIDFYISNYTGGSLGLCTNYGS